MSYEYILLERPGPIATLTFNRPDKHNCFNDAMIDEILHALRAVETDASVRVLVLKGAGKSFSSGADLEQYVQHTPTTVRASNRRWIDMFETLERIPQPVVASVHGAAIAGGTELTLACDMVVASERARFGLTEARVGVIPGAGACVRLVRWVGRAAAKEILMLGNPFSAEHAQRLGLCNRVVAADQLEAETQALASELCSRSPAALRAAKRAVNVGGDMEQKQGVEYVLQEFALLFGQHDQREGMAAFLEKRSPEFRDLDS